MAPLPGPDRPLLPGPDRPRRLKKAKAPKRLTPLYARAPGRGIRAPAVRPVAGPARPAGPSVAPAPGAAPAVGLSSLGPYAEYRDNPWAMRQLLQIDADQKAHQDYVSGTVAPWLSQGLTNLTGVDPSKPGINPTLQQQYLANVQGVVGGALNAAATAGPAQVAPTTPGGMVASPTAYLTQAAREGAQGRASSMLQSAQIQSALNTMQPNTQAQGSVYALAAYAAGLPAVYAERRSAARSKIDQFIADQQQAQARLQFDLAKQNEVMRHNRVSEATSATNSVTNAAFQASRLGLDANGQAFDQQGRLTAAATPAPAGYLAVPDGRGGTDYVRDPSVPQATAGGSGGGGGGTSTRDARGRLKVPSLQGQGFVQVPKGKLANYPSARYIIQQGADGRNWYKPRSSSSANPKPLVKAKDQQTLITDLRKAYDPTGEGTIAARNAGNPKAAATEVVRYILDRKNSFTTSGRKVDEAKLAAVLRAVIGGPDPAKAHGGVQWWVLDILRRGYRNADGTWK